MMTKKKSKTSKCKLCGYALPVNAMECPNCGTMFELDQSEKINSAAVPTPEPSAVDTMVCQLEGNETDKLDQDESSPDNSPELADDSVHKQGLDPDQHELIHSEIGESLVLNVSAEETAPLVPQQVLASAQYNSAPLPAASQADSRQHPRSHSCSRVWILSVLLFAGLIFLFSKYSGISNQLQAMSNNYLNAQNTVLAQSGSIHLAESTLTAQQNMISAQQTRLANQIDLDMTMLFGPVDGILIHNNDGLIKTYWAGQNFKNLIMSVVLVNPYDSTFHSWDTCIRFRRNYTDEYRLTIFSDQQWKLTFGLSTEPITSGTLTNLRVKEGESNTVLLVVRDEIASLKVNDVLVTYMDVSAYLETGDIGIAIGAWKGDEVNGKSTIFQEFMLWKIP